MKLIIIGAGATYGSSVVNRQLKPPLLKDLPKIISSSLISLNNSVDGPDFEKGFRELIILTDTENDIETYFTVLQTLGIISRQINREIVFMKDDEIKGVLKSDILQRTFLSTKLVEIARIILEYFLKNKKVALLNYPLNFQNMFQNSLREYFYHSLNNCYCIYHEKLFSDLSEKDAVVNFNYDEIADFTLFSMNKLSEKSFNGLFFNKISFPKDINCNCTPVKYLKIHGSFNWSRDIEKPFVYYNLISEACGKRMIGNTFFPIILPTITKGLLYRQYPIYSSHIYEFSSVLEKAAEIYIVGKTFINSDNEMNYIIKQQRKDKKCKLIMIDPSVKNDNFIHFHQELFNGTCDKKYISLENYYNEK